MTCYIYIVILLNLSFCSSYKDILSKLKICKRSDPNLNECLKVAIQAALPLLENGVAEINFPSLKPIFVEKAVTKGMPPLDFVQIYTNIELYHYNEAKIEDVRANVNEKDYSLIIKGSNPFTNFSCDYEYQKAFIEGIDISGMGKSSYFHYDFKFEMTISGKVEKNYLLVTNVTVVIDAKKFDIKFEPIDKELGTMLSDYFTTHGEMLFSAMKTELQEIYNGAYKRLAEIIFFKIPFNEIFLE